MTAPFFSIGIAILYFGWLWHERSAADLSKGRALDQPVKKSKRAKWSHAVQLAPVEHVTAKPFNLRDAATPLQQRAAQ